MRDYNNGRNGQGQMMQRGREPMTIFDLISRPLTDLDFFGGPRRPAALLDDVRVDIQDKGDHYELTADLPGTRKEDIHLDYEDGVFSLTATHHKQSEQKDNEGYLMRERISGSYSRSFAIDNIDQDGVEATFKDGELTVILKKTGKSSKRSIEIR